MTTATSKTATVYAPLTGVSFIKRENSAAFSLQATIPAAVRESVGTIDASRWTVTDKATGKVVLRRATRVLKTELPAGDYLIRVAIHPVKGGAGTFLEASVTGAAQSKKVVAKKSSEKIVKELVKKAKAVPTSERAAIDFMRGRSEIDSDVIAVAQHPKWGKVATATFLASYSAAKKITAARAEKDLNAAIVRATPATKVAKPRITSVPAVKKTSIVKDVKKAVAAQKIDPALVSKIASSDASTKVKKGLTGMLKHANVMAEIKNGVSPLGNKVIASFEADVLTHEGIVVKLTPIAGADLKGAIKKPYSDTFQDTLTGKRSVVKQLIARISQIVDPAKLTLSVLDKAGKAVSPGVTLAKLRA